MFRSKCRTRVYEWKSIGKTVVYVEEKKAQTYKEILELLTAEKSANSSVNDVDLILDPDSTHEMRLTVIDAATQAGFLRVKNKIQEL